MRLLAWLLCGLGLGCGGGECVDRDFDGLGEGCEAGPDCDDTNAARTDDCDRVPPPDCAADPLATGCPCLGRSSTVCYGAPPETEGIGACRAGNTICINGTWGLCSGVVLPSFERCDDVDQDCDGRTDEGVQSPCGACTPGCLGGVWGEGPEPFDPAAGRDVELTREGELTLVRDELSRSAIWIANSGEDTISRIDSAAAVETARYASGGDEPSRVAVDYHDDGWVANRAFDGQSTLTRVAGSIDRCIDGDGDLAIRTSTGPTDVLPAGEDECVTLTVPVGGPGGVARALAIDGDTGLDEISGGNPWVGMHEAMEVIRLDGLTGAELDRVPTPGFQPYAAAFDPWGTLWLISRDGLLARIDRQVRPLVAELIEVPTACFILYGLAVDREGLVLVTGFSCDQVLTYDPRSAIWRVSPTPPSVRGAVIAGDRAWVAHTDARVSELSLRPLGVLRTLELRGLAVDPVESIGVTVDGAGSVWVASSRGAPMGMGVATRVDPATSEVTAQVPVGFAPHTQGDLSGAKRLAAFRPEGEASHVFPGCPDGGTEWIRLHLAAEPGAAGSVDVELRHAADAGALGAATFTSLGTFPDDAPPFPLSLPVGGVVEVRLTLRTSARDGAPRVRRIGIEWQCPGPE